MTSTREGTKGVRTPPLEKKIGGKNYSEVPKNYSEVFPNL